MACYIVAEVAQSHDGSLGMAHAYIDAAAHAGADAVKFQTHIAEAESTPGEPWRVPFSSQDATRYDYWRRMEFTEPQWLELREHADKVGLDFLSSPFSIEAVELLDRISVAAWKIASGEVSNIPMLQRVAETRQPVILSSGMSGFGELDRAVALFREKGAELTVLQATSVYPCPPEQLGLNMISELRDRYGTRVGLSDHSGTIFSGLAAATLGADMLEVHVTFSRAMFGPDVASSITIEELRQLAEGVQFIAAALANPVDKDDVAEELAPMRQLFTKSVVAARDLPVGTTVQHDDLALKKPGTGIPASKLDAVIGRVVTRGIARDEQVLFADLEDGQ